MKTIDLTSLQTVKVGDQVVIKTSRGFSHRAVCRIIRVDRVTKTQIIAGKKRFRKRDGREIGVSRDRWTPSIHIYPLTSESQIWVDETYIRDRFEETMRQVHSINWQKCTLDQLEAVLRIVNQ